MRKITLNLSLLAALVVSANLLSNHGSEAQAQALPGSSAPPAPGFGQIGQADGVAGQNKANEPTTLPSDSVLSSNYDASASALITRPTGEKEVSSNGYNSLNSGSTNNTPVVYQDPESGIASIMQENQWRRMSTNLLNSPLALMNVTWQLTEPAVAQGFANAFQQSAWVNQLAYGGQQALMEQYKLGGTQGFAQAVSMLNCMRVEILRQQMANEPENWQKARMRCQGAYDTTTPAGSGSGVAAQEAKVDGSVAALTSDPSLNVVDCNQLEEQRKSEETLPAAQRKKGIMSFVDVRLQNLKPEERAKIKEEVGDIIYSYTHEFSQDASKPARAVLLATCIKPPTTPIWDQAKAMELSIWKQILAMFKARCIAAAQERDRSNEYVPFDPAKRNSFLENSSQFIEPLSFDEFKFTPNLLDITYNLFISKEIEELKESTCNARLDPDAERNDLEKLKKGQVKTRLEHRTIHQLVLWITQGKIFERAATRVKEINATSQGMNRQLDGRAAIVPAMYFLVARSVNMNSLEELSDAMQKNLAQLNAFKRQMEDQAAMVTGKGADILRSPFDESNKAPSAGGYGS